MKPCKFTFDDSPQFDGFAHGSTWNGFDNVAVTFDERRKIAQWMIESAFDKEAVQEEVLDLLAIAPIEHHTPELYSLGWGYATQIVREPQALPDNAAEQIAHRFVIVLMNWLDPAEWDEMRKLNAVQADPKICHSHDYCDANMAMAEAFESVVGRVPSGEDADNSLWNAAWEIAMPSLGRKA